MTQRIITTTDIVRPTAPVRARREPRWFSLGEAVTTVIDALFGASSDAGARQTRRDSDPALYRTLRDADLERLARQRPPLLY
jgi:hypothetical protein